MAICNARFTLHAVVILAAITLGFTANRYRSSLQDNNKTGLSVEQTVDSPSVARVYAHVDEKQPESYWNYKAVDIPRCSLDDYELGEKIGRGRYSDVFNGVHIPSNDRRVIKVLKPVKERTIKREIKVLQNVSQGPNIIQLLDVARDDATETTWLVFEPINNTDFRTLYPILADCDIRYYIYRLLEALDYTHAHGIMHRDIKPHNVLIDHTQGTLRLIDWGLAELYHHGREYNVRVASKYYKSPELLVGFRAYDYSLDMWSLGAMFASMIFRKEPFFCGDSVPNQLVKMADVLGTDDLFRYLEKYKIELDEQIRRNLTTGPRHSWTGFIDDDNQELANDQAIDFLDRILRFDHMERLTAQEAMGHSYFDAVRNAVKGP